MCRADTIFRFFNGSVCAHSLDSENQWSILRKLFSLFSDKRMGGCIFYETIYEIIYTDCS